MNTKRSWKSYLGAGALAFAVAMILNPEIRALLLLADVLGFEAIFLVLVAQARNYLPWLRVGAQSVRTALCPFSSSVGAFALRACQVNLPFRSLPILLGPVVIALSYGVHCTRQD